MESTNQIQGISFTTLAETYGTPAYIYDGQKIVEQVKTLKNAFSSVNLKIKYATKALSNLNVLKLLKNAGTGADAVSIEEVQLCLHAGFLPSEIMYTPNCVSFAEIQEAVALGVMINIDNIPMLEHFGNHYGKNVPICIRLNPHILAGGNAKISVGHIDSKFGISILQIKNILKVVETHHLDVIGLHIHTGSDILDADVFLKGAEILFDAARQFPDLKFLDFGGGFKVAYKPGDIATDIADVGEKVSKAFQEFCAEYGRELELWFEPGKFLVSESGFLLVSANVIKSTPACTFVGVDSGLNHLIRPMMYDAYHAVENVSQHEGPDHVYTVVGYICESDTIASDRKLKEVREGDLLVIKNAGAYGYSMSSNYNSRLRPPEVLILDGKAHLIRERETFEDILKHQVDIGL
ncbi:diaminopimelate decarboxylase [Rhodonellum psychrophilum GCM71 = DSM 17998]|uniref:Diaminopimelate decarboxylase n=2 Tax=Rhodonellum TaxID=336827 RepID=U5BTA3_9BACT|nr:MULTISPECIES: diaminopimelate decarboxylase [Rhodonellum]ERM83815.1 diaminopimelate decarboxylase [Rhodonellum psychrophilum GCM71 = DSM 17998]SDY65932.1 diaminopimelate decarboxylase [Rhodonellum ikkaensis]